MLLFYKIFFMRMLKLATIILLIIMIIRGDALVTDNLTALIFLGIPHLAKVLILWKMHRTLFSIVTSTLNYAAYIFAVVYMTVTLYHASNAVHSWLMIILINFALTEEIIMIITGKFKKHGSQF